MADRNYTPHISAAVIAAAISITVPWFCRSEGDSLKAYQDVAGVWTVCHGHAYVKPGTVMTDPQCTALANSDIGKIMSQVAPLLNADNLNALPHPEIVLSAYAHFAANIGISGFAHSQVLAFEKKNDFPASCEAVMNWYTAGGRDCRQDKGNPFGCYGLITRREEERDHCLSGLTPTKGT